MKTLKELLEDLECEYPARAGDTGIAALVYDSRSLSAGCLFVAIKGAKFDGHSAIVAAAEAGAAAVLAQEADEAQRKACEEAGCVLVITPDTRLALGVVSAAWFDHPADRLVTIGITGTKGKSSSAILAVAGLRGLGIPCGMIGTIEVDTTQRRIPAKNTTPESYELQSYLAEMLKAGCRAVVMEVSSQGLMMHRTAGMRFTVGVFTNISPDHIGPNEHKDFEDYLHCKSLLFKCCDTACINCDDPHAGDMLKECTARRVWRFGLGEEAELKAEEVQLYTGGGHLGVRFAMKGIGEGSIAVEQPFPGRFSVSNILSAMAASHTAAKALAVEGTEEEIAERLLEGFRGAVVKGRIELLPVSDSYTLMIDYAHNAMALESLLKTLREYGSGRIVSLFGCGGNRARSRRYEMGEVSGRLADLTVITSDNPRDEEPMDIIADIVEGMKKTDGEYITIPDRKEAIARCIADAKAGDIIVLAGKGHEDYQEIKGVKYPMDERRLVLEILKERGDDAAAERMLKRYPELSS
ncbi:MAG: UDP-N-acetylmuramoyl-L-alanyl-D-glutamate--2,6-diaminopimelate ligase [Lachnospiraceae bacterium]|nr:UDP-N-acetylmuramoyl-L-alanyl-D-glutamate--2,6-diaminopimelate ligase [Lachnospiraceae bacterium]